MEPVQYSISERNQIDFNVLHWNGTVPRALLFAGIAASAMAALGYALDGAEAVVLILIGGALGAGLVLLIARYIFVPRHAKRAWRDFALIQEPVELTLHEEGFSMVQPSAHVEALWQKMIAWDEDARTFAIYVTRQQAYILPKDQVGPAYVDYARGRLKDSGLTKKGTKRT